MEGEMKKQLLNNVERPRGEIEVGNEGEEGQQLKDKLWSETKKLWVVAGPVIFARFATFGVNVISQAFIGHIGSTELAAYALVGTVLLRFANSIQVMFHVVFFWLFLSFQTYFWNTKIKIKIKLKATFQGTWDFNIVGPIMPISWKVNSMKSYSYNQSYIYRCSCLIIVEDNILEQWSLVWTSSLGLHWWHFYLSKTYHLYLMVSQLKT